ncbi:LysR family transcriptional regulator [Achromobacter denitrificans]|uniref:LysR family transcriptional regulator n=1 Tax=Achromobacter denitrificans TaxID=32002 RepID=UPI0023E8F785|nr:LysR family transcriptional regulator [Achromobacter denitrificans]MDF3851601.1 LysR family transcriptional regulator [Achromobacter denitrificans]
MELRQLKQLLVLSETLNFHRAAERLHMAQPPLSTAIKKLEQELGVQLFDRLPGGLQPTPAAQVVLRYARTTLFYAEEIRRAAKEGASGEQGVLKVGFVGSSTYSLMPRLLSEFRRDFPRVDLIIEESTTIDLLRRLDTHTLDVALVRFPVLEPTAARITLLQPDHLMLAVPADSRHAQRDDVALSDLADEPFIGYSRTHVPGMHALVMYAFQQAGVVPRVAQEAIQVQTILSLVESGLGVAIVPAVARRQAGDNVRLVRVSQLADTIKVGIALAVHPDNATPTTANFVEMACRLMRTDTAATDEA